MQLRVLACSGAISKDCRIDHPTLVWQCALDGIPGPAGPASLGRRYHDRRATQGASSTGKTRALAIVTHNFRDLRGGTLPPAQMIKTSVKRKV